MTSTTPLVSVIIPTYNRASLLGEALASVAAQTCRDYEVIVIDDGSTDATPELPALRDPRVRYIWQENGGAARARNRGIDEARGQFVAFLDSDDRWLPPKLARCLAAANGDGRIVFHLMTEIDDTGRTVRGRSKRAFSGRIADALFQHCFVHTPTVLVRRDALRQVGGFDPQLPVCEDYELWLRLALLRRFELVREPLALRLLHERRLSKSDMIRNRLARARMLERFYLHQGGRERLSPRIARRRLSRVFCDAARANLREHRYADAAELLQRSLHYSPLALKPLWLSLIARLRRNGRDRPLPQPSSAGK